MNHMQETQLARPMFRPGTGWGRAPIPRAKSSPQAARYLIEGEWLTVIDIVGDSRNTRRIGRSGIWTRINNLKKQGMVVARKPYVKCDDPEPGNYALTWLDIQRAQGGRK